MVTRALHSAALEKKPFPFPFNRLLGGLDRKTLPNSHSAPPGGLELGTRDGGKQTTGYYLGLWCENHQQYDGIWRKTALTCVLQLSSTQKSHFKSLSMTAQRQHSIGKTSYFL